MILKTVVITDNCIYVYLCGKLLTIVSKDKRCMVRGMVWRPSTWSALRLQLGVAGCRPWQIYCLVSIDCSTNSLALLQLCTVFAYHF